MKDKKKYTKWDYINLVLLTIVFCILIWLIINNKFLLGSTTDWSSQHITFPEYFRTLFYDTKDFFPDFAFNIGSGQNIYNFAYYGLLNPVIILSYLVPNISMAVYIMVSTSVLILLSVFLMYKFLRNHNFSSGVTLLCSLIFMCATPLLFHLHRHIMFINYMPFLILGLIGIDKYFNENKSWLLVLSTLLMILMSYYYSVVGIIVFVVYGIYVYIKKNDNITVKKFFKDGFRFILPILIGVLISAILIVPTFWVILNGRGATSVTISLKDLIVPSINLDYILYKSYGIGLSSIAVFALIYLFIKKRENKFLAIVLSLIIIFPFLNYILNATMYIDAKILIPFLPLYILVIAIFLKDIFSKSVKLVPLLIISLIILFIGSFSLGNLKYILYIDILMFLISLVLYYKTNYKILFSISIFLMAFLMTLISSKADELVPNKRLFDDEYNNQLNAINDITSSDNDIYRISDQLTPLENTNRIYNNINYYQTTLYSSTYNKTYNNFYYDIMNNPIQSRNRVITSSAKNYPFLLLMGNKYLISNSKPFIGYEEVFSYDKVKVYKNDNTLPLAYASSNLLSLDSFNMLDYPYNQNAILNNIIVDKDINKSYNSEIEKIDLNILSKELNGLNYTKNDNGYVIDAKRKTKIKLGIDKQENKIIYIRFKVLESQSCDKGDLSVTINGITNKLTCESWKYHNGNYTFDYTLAYDKIDALNISFSKGLFKISDIETYILDASLLKNIKDNVDEFIFDKDTTKGDIINGSIDVTNDGYFVISTPYDKGFNIYVDGKLQDYEKVNVAFVGFPINKGSHNIKIEYIAPGKKLGTYMSISGLILYIGLIVYEEKRGKKDDRRIKN